MDWEQNSIELTDQIHLFIVRLTPQQYGNAETNRK